MNDEVRGGPSTIFTELLLWFCAGPCNLRTTGVVLPSPEGPFLLFAKLGTVVGDELALKQLWNVKGELWHKAMLCVQKYGGRVQ